MKLLSVVLNFISLTLLAIVPVSLSPNHFYGWVSLLKIELFLGYCGFHMLIYMKYVFIILLLQGLKIRACTSETDLFNEIF